MLKTPHKLQQPESSLQTSNIRAVSQRNKIAREEESIGQGFAS